MNISLKEIRIKRKKEFSEAIATETWFSTFLVRPFSLYITWCALKLNLSANTITIFSYIFSIIAAIVFSLGTHQTFVMGLLVVYLGFVVDCVDGEVARCTGKQTLTGAYLDTLGHIIYNSFINFGLSVGIYFQSGYFWVIVVGFISAFFYIPISRYSADHEILNRLRQKPHKGQKSSNNYYETKNIKIPNSIGIIHSIVTKFKKYGFPFIATPYNIITIGFSVILDIFFDNWLIFNIEVNFKSLLLVYNAIVVFSQQFGSLIRQIQENLIENELLNL